jgi:restriction system protein
VTLWVVKGGRGGVREARFLERSVIGIGWGEVGDLSSYPDRDALKAAYRGAFPSSSDPHVHTQVGQLWAFGARMQPGDIVVVPFLTRREIAIGEIRGPYRWLSDGDADMRHVRDVEWFVADLPREAFDVDLLHSFGGSMSICSVTRNGAERRVRAMVTMEDR